MAETPRAARAGVRDAVLALVEHVASEMAREEPERHRNQSRVRAMGEAFAAANYQVEAVHMILSVLAPTDVLKDYVKYAEASAAAAAPAAAAADVESEFDDTVLAPIETQLHTRLAEAAINDAGLRPVFGQLVEVALTGLFMSPLFRADTGVLCGLCDAERWWRRDPGVAGYVGYIHNAPIVFPRIEVEHRDADRESSDLHWLEEGRGARDAWTLRLSMPLIEIMSDATYARSWERRRRDGLRKVYRLNPCEFAVGRLFAHIRSLGIGTCTLENILGYEIGLDDERLERYVVDMFWNPRELVTARETDARRAANGTSENIELLWGDQAAVVGGVWPQILEPQLEFLRASMGGGHPQVERRKRLPYPRRLRWERPVSCPRNTSA